MSYEIVVPELSESVVEATVSEWLKSVGDSVEAGEVLLVLETDKVSLDVTADQAGVLAEIKHEAGSDVTAGEVLGIVETDGSAPPPKPEPQETPAKQDEPVKSTPATSKTADSVKVTPVAKRVADANNVDINSVKAGDGQKITKEDVEKHLTQKSTPAQPDQKTTSSGVGIPTLARDTTREERIKMSRRRRTIANRLVEAQSTAAMLTTFNEIDMKAVMDIRARHKDSFKEKHGVGLGFSSFFVKATIGALKAFPYLNAEIDGNEIVLKKYYDIGIAIGAEEGLVVPVVRDADRLTFAQIEQQIRDYAKQSREGTLSIDSLMGGTFTITNGGVFGSLLSTPILNYPQVGILGLHGIKERPVVVDGEIVIRPMMYTALTYDHRIVDGREAVQFLVKLGELIENPEQLLIEA